MNFSQHAKHSSPLAKGRNFVLRFVPVFAFSFLALTLTSIAQNDPPTQRPPAGLSQKNDSPADTAKVKKDSTQTRPKGDIESTIVYSADDSIVSQLGRKIVRLYGNAKVTYGKISLDAEEIVIDYEKSTITANGKKDSTGTLVGFPIFKDEIGRASCRERVLNLV